MRLIIKQFLKKNICIFYAHNSVLCKLEQARIANHDIINGIINLS